MAGFRTCRPGSGAHALNAELHLGRRQGCGKKPQLFYTCRCRLPESFQHPDFGRLQCITSQ